MFYLMVFTKKMIIFAARYKTIKTSDISVNMKKTVLLAALSAIASVAIAQVQLKSYSVYDVNHDNSVTVQDVTPVVNRALAHDTKDPQVVDITSLNAVLSDLQSQIDALRDGVDAIKNQLGIESFDPAGHDYVDLGIKTADDKPLLWATCNIGATKPEEAGYYFAWGETKGYTQDTSDGHSFDWNSYELCSVKKGGTVLMSKYEYNHTANESNVDDKYVLELEDDAARQNWHGGWRMPTKKEFDALISGCTWSWTTVNGVYGCLLKSNKNGNSIFLPASGHRIGNSFLDSGDYGYYWTSSLDEIRSTRANNISPNYQFPYYKSSVTERFVGMNVRAVLVKP